MVPHTEHLTPAVRPVEVQVAPTAESASSVCPRAASPVAPQSLQVAAIFANKINNII